MMSDTKRRYKSIESKSTLKMKLLVFWYYLIFTYYIIKNNINIIIYLHFLKKSSSQSTSEQISGKFLLGR